MKLERKASYEIGEIKIEKQAMKLERKASYEIGTKSKL